MIQHYLKIAYRNLYKFKTQSIIGILGMATGLAAFAFGWQWYKYETSYDSFYPKSDRMYIVSGIEKQTGKREQTLPLALLEVLKSEFPEVENATALYERFGSDYTSGEKKLGGPNMDFVDELFFDYFTPRVICGKENISLLSDEIVISRTMALKYWDSPEDALGSEIISGYENKYTVVSVIEDFPQNSIFHNREMWEPDIMTRKYSHYRDPVLRWKQKEITIFVCLEPSVKAKEFNRKIKNYLIEKEYNEDLILEIIPLNSIKHILGESFSISKVFNLNYIYLFIITTFILLLCVLVNYTNLYVTHIHGRIREIMLRHAVGAGKRELIFQIFIEIILQYILIFILASCFIELFTSAISKILYLEIDKGDLWKDFLITTMIGFLIVLLIQLPLFAYFVRNSAIKTSATGTRAHHTSLIRKLLLVFQVGICVAFMFCALGTGKQINYLSAKDLGFEKDRMLFFIMHNTDRKTTVEEIEKIAAIESLSSGGVFMYSSMPNTTNIVQWEDKPTDYKPNFQIIRCDPMFPSTFKLKLVDGVGFDEGIEVSERMTYEIKNEKKVGLINEEAARIIGKDNIIGRTIDVWNYRTLRDGTYETEPMEIIGVVKNFQSTSFMDAALPVIIIPESSHYNGYTYYARVASGNEETAKQQIISTFRKIAEPFDPEPEVYTMNEVFDELHKSENASFQLFTILAVLSILISLFGIYSVSEVSIHRRRKEIAVHKIMGGSTRNVATMLLKEYIWISLLANLIFIPIAWYFVNIWLEQFPYRINIGIIEILIILSITTVFIILTILGHILKASSENPAEVVKGE